MKLYIKQKVFALADNYKVYDENQKVRYHIEGKIFSLRGKMSLHDKNDKMIYRMQHRYLTFFNRYLDIFDTKGNLVATLKKHFLAFTPKLSINVAGDDYFVQGSFLQHRFTITKNDRVVAAVAKKWISWGDTYEITINDSEDEDFLVALVIGIDTLTHNDRYNNHSSHSN